LVDSTSPNEKLRGSRLVEDVLNKLEIESEGGKAKA
jgi:hypothetical protein